MTQGQDAVTIIASFISAFHERNTAKSITLTDVHRADRASPLEVPTMLQYAFLKARDMAMFFYKKKKRWGHSY